MHPCHLRRPSKRHRHVPKRIRKLHERSKRLLSDQKRYTEQLQWAHKRTQQIMERAKKAVSYSQPNCTTSFCCLSPVTPQSKSSKACRALTLFQNAGSVANTHGTDTPPSSNLKFWLAVSASALPCNLPSRKSKDVVEEGAVALLCTKLTWCAACNTKMHSRVRASMLVIMYWSVVNHTCKYICIYNNAYHHLPSLCNS